MAVDLRFIVRLIVAAGVVMRLVMLVWVLVYVTLVVPVVMSALVAVHVVFLVLVNIGPNRKGDPGADGCDAVLVDLAHREVKAHSEALQFRYQCVLIDAEVEQKPEEHVSGDS
jgi:hypothetical protein